MVEYITKTRDRIDRICFIHYGSTDNRVVEKVIEANPGLEEKGISLPAGLKIELPAFPENSEKPRIGKQIFLWS